MKKQVIEKLATLMTAAFGLVAALAWNDTIKGLFLKIFGTSDTFLAQLIYAILVTTIAVFVTIKIATLSEKVK
jgi:hypothetical protein